MSTAQSDFVVQTIDGKEFYVHTVEKGHTIYAISKLYQVEEEDIVGSNPEVKEGLSIGQTLYIPFNPEKRLTEEWHNPIRIEEGFLVHRVKRGETLFGISQTYKADVNEILEDNPPANSGIKKGMELMIRSNDVEESVAVKIEPQKTDSLKKHLVVQGETLYSISKLYEVGIEELKGVNGGLPEGLRTGDWIFIPQASELYIAQTGGVDYDIEITNVTPFDDGYNIAVLLPLYLGYDSLENGSRESILQNIGVQMYRGVSSALDSLTKIGLISNLKVFDVHDNKTASSVVKEEFLKNAHLVIGPLQSGPIGIVSDFTESKGIHTVCPVPQKNRVLLNHRNLSKTIGSDVSEMSALADFVAENHFPDNVILVNTTYIKDTRTTETFRSRYAESIKGFPSSSGGGLKEIRAESKSVGDIESQLSLLQTNVIVMPSMNESLIQDLLTKIGMTEEEDYNIVLYGMSGWDGLKIINPEYKNRFNVSYAVPQFADYQDENLQAFVKSYYDSYRSDPGEYCLTGFDVMSFFGTGLMQFGVNFPINFEEISPLYLFQSGFEFYQTGWESGFENKHFFMVEHVDYERKLKHLPEEGASNRNGR